MAQPIQKRVPEVVMRLARMGASHRTRLSFMTSLLRRIKAESWGFERHKWALNERGVGYAVYTVYAPYHRTYSLIAFSHDLPAQMRSDRVIATAWDATFTLFDGVPTAQDIERLQANVPLQEAGRVTDSELTLSRANRSVRLWEYVVNALAKGQQPDMDELLSVGYLMRTTAVYGSGKFGAADRGHIGGRTELAAPFRVEMLTVWLIREFTFDCVEHMASQLGGSQAAVLTPSNRRSLGVGNSTGLGMAPFLINHPRLLHQWTSSREEALRRVCAIPQASAQEKAVFLQVLEEAIANAWQWRSEHPIQALAIEDLRMDLGLLKERVHCVGLDQSHPWQALILWSQETLGLECQEQLLALVLEPYGDLIDELAEHMGIDESQSFTIHGAMSLQALRTLLEQRYSWVKDIDFSQPAASARFWYVSQEKLEPRLGERAKEAGAELELPIGTAWLIHQLMVCLSRSEHAHEQARVATFLLAHPEHRFAVRRVQILAAYPYAEIQDNLLANTMLPTNLLRSKLAFFGATKFDPRSDRWVRISMFQDAPLPQDLCVPPTQAQQSRPQMNVADARDKTQIRYSLSEIESLSKSAARGAGMDWGLAEEVGKAVRCLQAYGQPGAQALAALLYLHQGYTYAQICPDIQNQSWQAASGSLCPLIAGTCFLDHATLLKHWPLILKALPQPLLLIPFVMRAAATMQCHLRMECADVSVLASSDGALVVSAIGGKLDSEHFSKVQDVVIYPEPTTDSNPQETTSTWRYSHLAQTLNPLVRERLNALAQHTLVPASETSRADAGAAVRDND